jgi:hypothetical protein
MLFSDGFRIITVSRAHGREMARRAAEPIKEPNDPYDREVLWLPKSYPAPLARGLILCDMARLRKASNATAAASASMEVTPFCWTTPLRLCPNIQN